MENDTVLAITRPQLVKINRSLNDYFHLKKINKTLQMDLSISDSLCFYWKQVALKRDSIIFLDSLRFEESLRITDELKNSLRVQKNKSRKKIVEVGVGGVILGSLLGILLR